MDLSKRLSATAGLVTKGASVADVGTDHGYIPIYLMEQGISPKVIALDINEGPLDRAREHITACGLEDKIEIRLSDGLKNVLPGEVDVMIASGMGGSLVIRIMEEGRKIMESLRFWILQPQSEIHKVRRYINENGMRIVAEDMVREDGKYYPVMKVVWGETENYEEWEYRYGKRLLEERHPVLLSYVKKEKRIWEDILKQLDEQEKTEKTRRRIRELEREISCAGRALACYELDC